jgi:hypothetical protein
MSHFYKSIAPPQANWRWSFGNSTDVYFQFYIAKPPNRLQRWLTHKLLGIRWEPVPPTKPQL